jgi:hypothetical protein
MAGMSLTWILQDHGWAVCVVADAQARAEAIASCVTGGPEDFLTAVARLVLGADASRADLEAEPTVYRWIFQRHGTDADIRLLLVPDGKLPDGAGTIVWTSRQPVDTVARAVVRAFDAVATEHGENGYEAQWGRPFPRFELEALRRAWRGAQRQGRPL